MAEIAIATGNNERTVRREMRRIRDQLKQRCLECAGE
jgi:DNA-directed RNA polymerase specialized sigma24 family protein